MLIVTFIQQLQEEPTEPNYLALLHDAAKLWNRTHNHRSQSPEWINAPGRCMEEGINISFFIRRELAAPFHADKLHRIVDGAINKLLVSLVPESKRTELGEVEIS